jgi:hypothetical protein
MRLVKREGKELMGLKNGIGGEEGRQASHCQLDCYLVYGAKTVRVAMDLSVTRQYIHLFGPLKKHLGG